MKAFFFVMLAFALCSVCFINITSMDLDLYGLLLMMLVLVAWCLIEFDNLGLFL